VDLNISIVFDFDRETATRWFTVSVIVKAAVIINNKNMLQGII